MDSPSPNDAEQKHQGNLVGLAFVLALVVIGVLLMLKLKHDTAVQDCLIAGHHNCMPLDIPDAR
jgi:hypothetical protein